MSRWLPTEGGGVSPALPVLIALVFANFLDDDLRGVRPALRVGGEVSPRMDQAVPARLWRDPLEAVYHYEARRNDPKQAHTGLMALRPPLSAAELRAEIREAATQGSLLVLPVLVSGENRAEEHETRLRERYAVVSALTTSWKHRAGENEAPWNCGEEADVSLALVPAAPDFLGLVEVPSTNRVDVYRRTHWGNESCTAEPSLDRLILPFEWYQCQPAPSLGRSSSRQVTGRKVLVLWVDEQSIIDNPLVRIASAIETLMPRQSPQLDVQVAILGPSDSTVLVEMLDDDGQWPDCLPKDEKGWIAEATLYSHRATLTLADVRVNATAMPPKRAMPQSDLDSRDVEGAPPAALRWRCGLRFQRMIGADDRLATTLLKEFLLRRPDRFPHDYEFPCGSLARDSPELNDPRSLPSVLGMGARWLLRSCQFTKSLDELTPADGAPGASFRIGLVTELDTNYGRAWKSLLDDATQSIFGPGHFDVDLLLQYMRGLDGRIPGIEALDVESILQEPSTGEGRTDYIRRIKEQVLANQGDGPNSAPYDAIGILGTDVYDKAVLIQELRPLFPEAIFFTTDVDARLLPSQSSPHSLGMLIASYHGIRVGRHLSDLEVLQPAQMVVPMRSGYQLATFLSTARALEARCLGPGSSPGVAGCDPRIYEVGRSRLHELSFAAEAQQDGSSERAHLGCGHDLGGADSAAVQDVLNSPEAPHSWALRSANKKGVGLLFLAAVVIVLSSIAWGFHRLKRRRLRLGSLLEARPGPRSRPRRSRALLAVRSAKRKLKRAVPAYPRLSAVVAIGIPMMVFFYLLTVSWGAGRSMMTFSAEPFFLFEGISAWPTIVLRVLAALCSLVGLCSVAHGLRRVRSRLKAWSPPVASKELTENWGERGSVHRIRAEFLRSTRKWPLIWATVVPALLFNSCCGLAFDHLGRDLVPIRTEGVYLLERFALLTSVLGFLGLNFFVLRITVLARKALRRIKKADSNDPLFERKAELLAQRFTPPVVVPFALRPVPHYYRELARVELARDLADPVARFIRWPGMVLFLMVVSRASVFDRWTWPVALVCILGLSFLVILIAAQGLRQAAARIREHSLDDLSAQRAFEPSGDVRSRLGVAIDELKSLHSGVFAPFWSHPILRAWLVPLAALGANASLEFLLPSMSSLQ